MPPNPPDGAMTRNFPEGGRLALKEGALPRFGAK